MSTAYSWPSSARSGHLVDRAAAVAPVRVHVQVAAQRREQRRHPRRGRAWTCLRARRGTSGTSPRAHSAKTADVFGPMPCQIGQRPPLRASGDVVDREVGQRRCRSAKRLHSVGGRQLTLEEKCDASQPAMPRPTSRVTPCSQPPPTARRVCIRDASARLTALPLAACRLPLADAYPYSVRVSVRNRCPGAVSQADT